LVRDGQVTNRPVYVAIGVSVNGERDMLGLWAGDGGEGAKFWLSVLTEIKNRGVEDVCITVCDGLTGLPEAINTVWELTVVQTCIVHLIRNTFRYTARQYWDEMSRDLRQVYTAPSESAAKERFVDSTKRGRQYPAITRLWEDAWSEFVPFLDYDVEIWRVICSTSAIESLNAPRPLPARGPGQGPFPHRAGGPEMPLPGHPDTGPDRQRQGTMGLTVEAGAERLRHQLRRKNQLNANCESTDKRTLPLT
jgi:transposase-like protein